MGCAARTSGAQMGEVVKPEKKQSPGAVFFLSVVIAAFFACLAGSFALSGWAIAATALGSWLVSFVVLAHIDIHYWEG